MPLSKKMIQQMNDYYGCEYIVTEKPKKKMPLKQLIKKINKENTPPGGWSPEDAVQQDKPEAGKTYALTGGTGARCIANGFSWKDSVVREDGDEE